jgi:hypothetical protein
MSWKTTCVLVLGASVLFVSSSARAEDPPTAATATPTPTPAPAAAPTATPAPAKEGGADHDLFVGHVAVGYFGISQLPIGALDNAGAFVRGNVPAPVIGARYWIQRNVGIDVGLGFATIGGSREVVAGAPTNTTTTTDHPSATGFAFHLGVPIAFAYGKHYTFELIPETTLGFTTGTIKGAPGNPDTNLSGFKWDIGARIGSEVHFGFIGVPELALQASVGLGFRRETFKVKTDPNSASDGTSTFTTTVGSDPWALFTNNISALYYF